ncbi:MAG: alpha/beta hydrolase [Oscillospiraceae bacterium]|nr:alpha/beta hydrolase [Oscillospiraceae bacterium]
MARRHIQKIMIVLFVILLCFNGCALTEGKQKEAPEDMLVKTATFGERKMDYLRFGNKDGEKFVILPGLALKSVMGSAEAIVRAYALLAENYDVYLFDHIWEEPEGYTIAGMAEDTLSAFDRLGLEKVHLMGVSMGGMVAQTIAVKAPERVSSLILCSTAMNTVRSDPAVFANWESLAEQKNAAALMAAFGETVYTPSFYAQYKDAIIASGEGTTDLDYHNFLVSLNAIRSFDLRDDVRKIICPVYVIGAGEDHVLGVQASADLIEALKCEYYIYEGCGHGVYDEAPDYLTHIDSFLKERSSP